MKGRGTRVLTPTDLQAVSAITTLAGRLTRLAQQLNHKDTEAPRKLTNGKSLGELAKNLLNVFDPDHIAAEVQKKKFGDTVPSGVLSQPPSSELSPLRVFALNQACARFENPGSPRRSRESKTGRRANHRHRHD